MTARLFHLPTGRAVEIDVPKPEMLAHQLDSFVSALAEVYPYLGFRPGLVLPEGDTLVTFNDSTFSRFMSLTAPRRGQVWGDYDTVPVVWAHAGPPGQGAADFVQVTAVNPTWTAFWNVASSRIGLNSDSGSAEELTAHAFAVVLWWPPDSYAQIVTQADVWEQT